MMNQVKQLIVNASACGHQVLGTRMGFTERPWAYFPKRRTILSPGPAPSIPTPVFTNSSQHLRAFSISRALPRTTSTSCTFITQVTAPSDYRVNYQRAKSTPVAVKDMQAIIERLSRPTFSSRARSHMPQMRDIHIIGAYTWTASGLNAFRDTQKSMYTPHGSIKTGVQK